MAPQRAAERRSRRQFIKTGSSLLAGGVVAGGLSLARAARAYGTDEIRLGLVGCGKRGTAAAAQALRTPGPTRLVAAADAFPDRLQAALRGLKSQHGERVAVPPGHRFAGLEAYRGVLECDVDLVILAAPPAFRPLHFEAAVRAGKHVFMEIPVAVDAPGVRRVLAAAALAGNRGLAVAVGLHRRHEPRYRETIRRLRDGAIGDVRLVRVYWNGAGLPLRARRRGESELEFQLRNWRHFTWLSGDHIVERHVHNLDVGNWLMDDHPAFASGLGGRWFSRTGDAGDAFDYHVVEYTFRTGAKMYSQCRRLSGCWTIVCEHAHGPRGAADLSGGKIYGPGGKLVWRYGKGGGRGHDREQEDLFADLRAGRLVNEAEAAALSTMTAIMGRMATYSTRQIGWSEALASDLALADVGGLRSLSDPPPAPPDTEGRCDRAVHSAAARV